MDNSQVHVFWIDSERYFSGRASPGGISRLGCMAAHSLLLHRNHHRARIHIPVALDIAQRHLDQSIIPVDIGVEYFEVQKSFNF